MTWLEQFEEVIIAIEDCRHLTRRLEADLLDAGHKVVRVHTRLMAGMRRSGREPGSAASVPRTEFPKKRFVWEKIIPRESPIQTSFGFAWKYPVAYPAAYPVAPRWRGNQTAHRSERGIVRCVPPRATPQCRSRARSWLVGRAVAGFGFATG